MALCLGCGVSPLVVEVPHLQHAPGQYNGSARVWRLPPQHAPGQYNGSARVYMYTPICTACSCELDLCTYCTHM